MTLEFYIACAPEDHPVMAEQVAFARHVGPGEAKKRAAAFATIIMSERDLKTGTKKRTRLGIALE